MLGWKPLPVKVTFLGRTNGINALLIVLLPITSSVTCSTTLVLNPVLVWSVLEVAPTLIFLRTIPACILSAKLSTCVIPLQVVSHAFQTVPIAFLFAASIASKLPSWFIITAGAVSVSNHSSPDGLNSILPTKLASRYGCIFSVFVAYCCSARVVCVYGSVIRSPVFW